MYEIPGYDAWKTACCEKYPDCSHCGEEDDEECEEFYEEEEEDEDEISESIRIKHCKM